MKSQEKTFNEFIEDADYAVIEDAYKRASRVISPDLAKSYSEHLAAQKEDAEDDEEALIDAHTDIAAMGLVPEIKSKLDVAAEELAETWLTEYRVEIKSLNDKRQDVYRDIREMSADPLDVDLARPMAWLQMTEAKEPNGKTVVLPRYENHLMCDDEGFFPDTFNIDEQEVLKAEMGRPDFLAWYRNPARTSQDSLGVSYEMDGTPRIVRPDFICFAKLPDDKITADIVDPHGTYLSDALPKLQGLARYAEKHQGTFRRIDSIAKMSSGEFRVLDMTEAGVRDAVLKASSATSLFDSNFAAKY